MTMSETTFPLLARQPIFNTKMKVVAYELLCRTSHVNQANFSNADAASSQVLLNAFTELSINHVVGKHLAFINFTRTLIETPPPFDKKQLVVEVLEGVNVDETVLEALRLLREKNYLIALDDFVLSPETEQLLPYAHIVKLDVLHLSKEQLLDHIAHLKNFKVKLLAEKVETYEMLEYCKSLGFDLFQGYFLARPQIMTGKKIAENKQSVIQLLAKLQEPDVTVDEIEKLLARDTVLSFKLLRLINSAAFGLTRQVDSLKQAIMLLGVNKIKNWVNILAMSNLGDKPQELSVTALTRARMCELVANKLAGKPKADGYFTVGLLSTLDAFMDAPMNSLLESISLSKHINEALLNYLGQEGKVLEIVTSYEKGDWNNIDWDYLNNEGISSEDLSKIYVESLDWVAQAMKELGIEQTN